MVVSDNPKSSRGVRPKLKCLDNTDNKNVTKTEKKHRLKQRFEVIKKLGQGTYGKVQLAINKETGQEVAIKTIKKSKVENEQDLIRIKREIQIMSSIQHPHIIHIYEVFENKDKIVLVMQYASGGEVYDYVSHRKVLSDTEARRLFRQIATAIYYCHKNKICHRDLKLENILLDEKGNAKIADFGLSNVFDEKHFLQTFCGSPLYASPEIVKGQPYYGPEVDCWSLGVLLYTLVYGAMPFDGSNFKRLVKQISESNYFEPNEKSEASQLIKKLLAPNPAKRATILDICTDWWVNVGYEHSLLQVAEDMANLTPVRLEILLALAPVSPADKTLTNPFEAIKPNAEEEKANVNLDNNNEQIMESLVTDNDTEPKKRVANQSFDQNLAQTQTKVPKKKKTKNESKTTTNKDNDNTEEVNEKVCDISNDNNLTDFQMGSETCPQQTLDLQTNINKESENINKDQDVNENKLSVDVLNLKEQVKSIDNIPEKEPQLIEEMDVSNKVSENESNVSQIICETIENHDQQNNKQQDKTNELEENKEMSKSQISIDNKQDDIPKIEQVETDVKTTQDKNNEKIPERRTSVKRPGRLSIPNIWNKNIEDSDNKLKPSEKSNDNRAERKAPFIPVGFRVSDAKRAFERRCSVPANNLQFLQKSSSNLNKLNESDNCEENIVKSRGRQRAPKLNTRSMSLNVMLESPKKVKELNELLKDKDHSEKSITDKDIKITENKVVDDTKDAILEESSAAEECARQSLSPPVVSKDMAKDILKKSIAKAQLKQKKNNSNESLNSSPVTTPLIPSDNKEVSVESSDKTIARLITKESGEKEIEFNVDLRPRAKDESQGTKQEICDNSSLDMSLKSSEDQEQYNNDKVDIAENKPQPIARSYKKVTFTKDGACITETGKIYSSEGNGGSYTRVERKSKVTHFPSIDAPKSSSDSLHRSDSQSSSGSVDIFDDIFDNHWTGDEILFPNMKSILQGLTGKAKARRRSRAESCERNASDWHGLRKNALNMSGQDLDDDEFDMFSSSLRPARPLASLFDKSIFSRHFSDFDKDFDDSLHSVNDLNRSVSRESRDRTSMSSRIHPTSFKVVFGPQTSVRSNSGRHVNETDDYLVESPAVTNDSRSHLTDRSRDSDMFFPRKTDSIDSCQKRVEQWLHSDNQNDDDDFELRKDPLSMYATVGPRGVRRYLRTMTSRPNDSRTSLDNMGPSSSTCNMGLYRTSSQTNAGSKSTVPRDTVLNLRINLKPEPNESSTAKPNISHSETEGSDDYQSSILLPESSSLLDQLRTHGYRNIVSQRLSGPSLFADLDTSLSESDNKPYKRGNRVLAANARARECMPAESTNPKASSTSSSISSESASVATHINGHNIDNTDIMSKASEFANQIDFTEMISESLNNCLNQQSCESTSRGSASQAYRNQSNNSKTALHSDRTDRTERTDRTNPSERADYHLEQTHRNPTHVSPDITTNKSVNFKESVQERIHRKSFYSRFNEDRPLVSSRLRRRSYVDSEDIDIALGLRSPSLLTRSSNSFRTSLSMDPDMSPEHSFSVNSLLSKPPSSASDWFTRMESRASQLMDDLLENDNIFSSNNSLNRFARKSSQNSFSSNLLRRRSASATRSPLSDHLTTDHNHNHNTQNDLNSDHILRDPTEVIQRAIDILSQTSDYKRQNRQN